MQRLVAILERHRLSLLAAGLAGAILGTVAGLLRPPSYQANAKLVIVPVDDPTATGGVTAGYDLATVTLPVVMAILHSTSLGERAAAKLDLARVWHVTPAQAQARVFAGVIVGSERKTNLVTLAYTDRSPEVARDVVAALSDLATEMSAELWSARNRHHREKLESELAEIDARLAAAERALQEFRESNHVVDLPEQIRATVEEGAALERMRIGKSIDVRIAGGFGGPESVEVKKGSIERAAAERALRTLRAGRGASPLLPLDDLPRLEIEHARLKRAVDEQAGRRDLLSLKISQLLAAEARPGGVAQVIDPPLLPTTRLYGGVARLALIGAVLSALLVALFIWRRASRPVSLPPMTGLEIRSNAG